MQDGIPLSLEPAPRSSQPRRFSLSGDTHSDGRQRNSTASITSVHGENEVANQESIRLEEQIIQDELRKTATCRYYCSRILNNNAYILLMSTLTVFVLVGDDLRVGFVSPTADPMFNYFNITCLVLFIVEIVISCVAKSDYLFSFWFAADMLASVSLVLDLTFVNDALLGETSIQVESASSSGNGAISDAEYARASRSGRVGTRVARLLRVLRLVRLTRILHLLIRFSPYHDKSARLPGEEVGEDSDAAAHESKVGKKLSEKTTQRVIVLVLAMLIIMPYLDVGEANEMEKVSAEYGADAILQEWQEYEAQMYANGSNIECCRDYRLNWEKELLSYVFYHVDVEDSCNDLTIDCDRSFLHRLSWVGYVKNMPGNLDPLRVMDSGYVQQAFTDDGVTDVQAEIIQAIPKNLRTVLARPWTTDCSEGASLILGVSLVEGINCPRLSYRLGETMYYLPQVTRPDAFGKHMEAQFIFIFDVRHEITWSSILGMAQTVYVVIVLVVASLFFSKDVDNLVLYPIERMIEQVLRIRRDPIYVLNLAKDTAARHAQGVVKRDKLMETRVLENTITKLGSLLALCFGEAGAETIGENLYADDATVDALIPGFRVEAIYGICTMNDFATVTEVLQQNMIIFVNQVSEIVHRIADRHIGAVTGQRGTGAQYLLVWRIENFSERLHEKIADLAVMSMVQVGVEVNRDRELHTLWEHPGIRSRIKSSSIRLGFGLHLGWAIEGAIGSEMKIDVSYVSPNVNLAGQLAANTGFYGVNALLSHPLVKTCSEAMRDYLRPVDHVRTEGATAPVRLYTIDVDYSLLEKETKVESRWKALQTKDMKRQEHEQYKLDNMREDKYVHSLFVTDPHLVKMRRYYTTAFYEKFGRGYLNYEAGEWEYAAEVFQETRFMLRDGKLEDGPSRALLEYIDGCGRQAPAGWRGYHGLSSGTLAAAAKLETARDIPDEWKIPSTGLSQRIAALSAI